VKRREKETGEKTDFEFKKRAFKRANSEYNRANLKRAKNRKNKPANRSNPDLQKRNGRKIE
jgi:hypothetical protein